MTQTYIAGIGASGALLAGAAVTLISLVGLVSFQVWPESPDIALPAEEVELNLPAIDLAEGGDAGGSPLSAAAGELASISPSGTGGAPDGPARTPDRDPAPGEPDAPAPPPVSETPEVPEPAPVEPDSRAGGESSVGKDLKKILTPGDRQRPEFDDEEREVPTQPKALPARPDSGRVGYTDPGATEPDTSSLRRRVR